MMDEHLTVDNWLICKDRNGHQCILEIKGSRLVKATWTLLDSESTGFDQTSYNDIKW